ncbi:jouberin isoform X2 [Phascolarctos cinereus]|uniref:Jouberin n=1 Tax=Phascolarctos cinereus TaxID=38626 RepID=A0A6P5KBB4_PHACI|nr:jouberin isoform X2 [Phascolarctos cinereus]
MLTVESEAKAKTKVRFEELFRSHADLVADKKKSKKKVINSEDNILLDTLRSNHDLTKESRSDEAIISSTYIPEKSPRFTKNKPKDRRSIAEKISSDDFTVEENQQVKPNKKKKKSVLQEQSNKEENTEEVEPGSFERKISHSQRKTKNKLPSGVSHQKSEKIKSAPDEVRDTTELDEEEQLIQAYELQVAEEAANAIRKKIRMKLKEQMSHLVSDNQNHEEILNNEVGKNKKKKKVPVLPETETSVASVSELQHNVGEENIKKKKSSEAVLTSDFNQRNEIKADDQTVEENVEQPKAKTRKTKKKIKAVSEDNEEGGIDNVQEVTSPEVSSQTNSGFDDTLVLGVYVHRTDRLQADFMISHPMVKIHVIDQNTGLYVKKEHSNRAVSSFYEQERVENVLPIMTQPYDFKHFKSRLPEWEEQIVFNERFSYFLQESEESPRVILFFELVGANRVLNINGKLRLQLYCPPPRIRSQLNVVEVFEWWSKCPRIRYPSTLYVTIKGLKFPDHVDPSFRSMMALQQEQGSTSYGELQKETSKRGSEPVLEDQKEIIKWSRLPGQVCRIPNKHLFSLHAGERGCFCINFSQNGRMLAAACAGHDGYPVILYEIPSGRSLREFCGHLNIVYDLCWSKDDQHLLTASSDSTVRMWKIESQGSSAVKVFPHPSFVYTAKFHPVAGYLVVTGCYDSVIRVWNVQVQEVHGQLLQEFDGHKSFINSLCFDAEGLHMYSGDSSGLIIVWNTLVRENEQHPVRLWNINKEIRENDIKGIPISHLEVHPNGRRLLIHAKDSTLRIMDLRILATRKYVGAANYREKIHSTLTPCGTFLFSGSEDGVAYVWNPETGDQVAMYSDLSFTSPLRDVAFHPHEHMVAFCAFGQNEPILAYIYDYKVAHQEAKMVTDVNGSLTATGTHRNPLIFSSSSAMQDTVASATDQFISAARVSMRMQKVKQKLESVTASSNLLLPAPSLFSPHSKFRLSNTMGTHLIPQHPFNTQSGGFNPVGKPTRIPSSTLQMSDSSVVSLPKRIGTGGSLPGPETVVALYDYTAHRSDELTIHRSDIIQVLYKDNDNWWFGSLTNGQQGYFPANYVAGEKQYDTQSSEIVQESSYFSTKQTEEKRSPILQEMSKALSKSQDLKLSDTHLESPAIQEVRKKKRLQKNEMTGSKLNEMALRPSEIPDVNVQVEGESRLVLRAEAQKSPKRALTPSKMAKEMNGALESGSLKPV